MKINFDQELKTIEGTTLMRTKSDGDEVTPVPATLRWACVEALLATSGEMAKLSGEQKAKRYDLALKVQGANGPLELGVEDVAEIRKLCDAHFAPLIVGQTRRLLDPTSE